MNPWEQPGLSIRERAEAVAQLRAFVAARSASLVPGGAQRQQTTDIGTMDTKLIGEIADAH